MDLNLIVELLKEINVVQIFIILLGVWFFYVRLDKKIIELENKLDKRITDSENKIDKKFIDLENKIDKKFIDLENKVSEGDNKLSDKLERMEKDLQSVNTKIAVIESRMNDISNNVSHLMWHSQIHPQKEAKEE